jgi:hypothetical protein
MGMVIRLPEAARGARGDGVRGEGERRQSATVIILPVIRIERYSDEPSDREATRGNRRRRRRRTSPS